MNTPSQSLPPPPLAHLDTIWAQRGIDATLVAVDSQGTVGRSGVRVAETLAARPAARGFGVNDQGYELGPVIGKGGMGVVRLATQTSLKRTVAVKQVIEHNDRVVSALLREAWIAGNLEHPNILPIHALTESERGGPLLVMKRIEGVPWSDVLRDPEKAPGGRPDGDLLVWHLQVFDRLCHAVHFAHDRGVVHLDLKPDNVMLGHFGEVYLVDWGLAASLELSPPPWMPRAGEIDTVLGTPGYMPPELAIGAGEWIDARTDVYQLGAVLHELITGRPLHDGAVMEAIGKAFRSAPPDLPSEVPEELANICRMAVARDRDERFQTVEALRHAVAAFLQHRHAAALTEQALERLEDKAADARRVIDEVRFGLRLALRAWPQQPKARAALARLQRTIVERQIRAGDLHAARATLAEMESPEPALAQRIDRVASARAAAELKAASLERDLDLSLNRRLRLKWVAGLGVTWVAWNFTWGAIVRNGLLEFGHVHLVVMSLVTLVLFALGAWTVRDSLRSVAVDRKIVDTLGAGLATVPLLWIAGASLGLQPNQTVALSVMLYVFFMCVLAIGADRRIRWVPLTLLPLAICAPIWPAYAFEMAGLAGLLCALPTAWIWARAAD